MATQPFQPVALVGRMSVNDMLTRLKNLDREADYCRDWQDGAEGVESFQYVQATNRLDTVQQHITAIERDLRERFAGIDLMALAQRIG